MQQLRNTPLHFPRALFENFQRNDETLSFISSPLKLPKEEGESPLPRGEARRYNKDPYPDRQQHGSLIVIWAWGNGSTLESDSNSVGRKGGWRGGSLLVPKAHRSFMGHLPGVSPVKPTPTRLPPPGRDPFWPPPYIILLSSLEWIGIRGYIYIYI